MEQQQTAAERRSLRHEMAGRTLELGISGLGLVAALAWNDAIQELFHTLFGTASTVAAKFFYAVLVTTFVVLLTRHLASLNNRLKK